MRVFVAAEIPDEIRARLAGIQAVLGDLGMKQIRWVEPSRIHLTLRFCGEMSSDAAQCLSDALSAPPPVPAFRASLEGLQCFPPRGSPHVVVLSVARSQRLARLAEWVDVAARSVGVEKEDRPFRPHLTLGRFRSGGHPRSLRTTRLPGDLTAALDFTVARFQMMESRLGAGGPVYLVMGEYSLPAAQPA